MLGGLPCSPFLKERFMTAILAAICALAHLISITTIPPLVS
jgi:hypothetical protein